MPYALAQAGGSLQRIDTSGNLTTLSLPSGVTISSALRGQFAILGRQILFAYAPTINLWIDPLDNTIRPMVLRAPSSPPILAAGGSTGLTGAYRVKVSFVLKDSAGRVISESPLSPASPAFTLANQSLSVTGIPISLDTSYVSARRLYRTVAGGTVYFQWLDVDGNSATAVDNNLADAGLALLPENPDLGAPAGTVQGVGLKLLTAWQDRLWGVSSAFESRDFINYSALRLHYAWPSVNELVATPAGEDAYGVVAFLKRRDELGIGKRTRIGKIVGNNTNGFRYLPVVDGVGIAASQSAVTINDIVYFLSDDGVYTYDANGVQCISRAQVDPWFNPSSTPTFNRDYLDTAFAGYNPVLDTYDLYQIVQGSTTEYRWVSYHRREKVWTGPHKIDAGAFTASARAILRNASGAIFPVTAGTNGHLHTMNSRTLHDGASSAIDAIVKTKAFSGDAPDIEHLWEQFSVLSKIQAAGTATITPYVGGLDASAGPTISMDLTSGRQKLPVLGPGRLCQLQFQQAVADQDMELYGFELPFFELGRR